MINWTVTKEEAVLQSEIANRAVEMASKARFKYKKLDALMDIAACHGNGNPLRLQELLVADDFNFAHDVFGIRNCIDRNTGKLNGTFSPRYSQH